MRSNGVTKLKIWASKLGVFSVTFHEVSSWKCQHATESWESGHRKRCVILSYNKYPLMYEAREKYDSENSRVYKGIHRYHVEQVAYNTGVP